MLRNAILNTIKWFNLHFEPHALKWHFEYMLHNAILNTIEGFDSHFDPHAPKCHFESHACNGIGGRKTCWHCAPEGTKQLLYCLKAKHSVRNREARLSGSVAALPSSSADRQSHSARHARQAHTGKDCLIIVLRDRIILETHSTPFLVVL
jgi:hypothetical protein